MSNFEERVALTERTIARTLANLSEGWAADEQLLDQDEQAILAVAFFKERRERLAAIVARNVADVLAQQASPTDPTLKDFARALGYNVDLVPRCDPFVTIADAEMFYRERLSVEREEGREEGARREALTDSRWQDAVRGVRERIARELGSEASLSPNERDLVAAGDRVAGMLAQLQKMLAAHDLLLNEAFAAVGATDLHDFAARVASLRGAQQASEPTPNADAARWAWLRENGCLSTNEDGALWIGALLTEDFEDTETPELRPDERAELLGKGKGMMPTGDALDRAVDAVRGASVAPEPEARSLSQLRRLAVQTGTCRVCGHSDGASVAPPPTRERCEHGKALVVRGGTSSNTMHYAHEDDGVPCDPAAPPPTPRDEPTT